MFYSYRLVTMVIFSSLVLSLLTSCSVQQIKQAAIQRSVIDMKMSTSLASELERITQFRFTHVAFFNSRTGSDTFLVHNEALVPVDSKITEIKSITSFSVIGVADITLNEKVYPSCNFINFNGGTTAICSRGNNPPLQSNPIESFSSDIAGMIEKESGVSNIDFILLTNVQDGTTKLFRNENYDSFQDVLPHSVSEIKNGTSWSVVTFKKNPCCTSTWSGGTWHTTCDRSVPACP